MGKQLKNKTLKIESEDDIVRVRMIAREYAEDLDFKLVKRTKLVTASSEIARNTLLFGGGGVVEIEAVSNDEDTGIRLTFKDKGPGIADIEIAMQKGFSSQGGLGLGLPGTKRMVDDFLIVSHVGEGTRVKFTMWR